MDTNWKYRIPYIEIQDFLIYIDTNSKFIEIQEWLTNNYGSKYDIWDFDFELSRQWYPVLLTNDPYLVKHFIETFS